MMKKLFTLVAFLAICNLVAGQTESESFKKKQLSNNALTSIELKDKFATNDFSSLWTHTENSSVYGLIGDNYQRIRVKFISVTKDTSASDITWFMVSQWLKIISMNFTAQLKFP